MSKMEKIEQRLVEVNNLANEVAKKANDELYIEKHKITCLMVLVALFAIIGVSIAFYSIHTMEKLFYNMSVEEEYIETIGQEANSENGNAININGDSNKVGN